jgi:hypothetical protein
MASCVYDNPTTCRREHWVNGRLVSFISESLMCVKGFNGHKRLPFELNVGKEFVAGRLFGSKEAMESS